MKYAAVHKEQVAAIEKGLDLPPWPEGLFHAKEGPKTVESSTPRL